MIDFIQVRVLNRRQAAIPGISQSMTATVARQLPLQLEENGCDDLDDADKSPVTGPKPTTVKKQKVGHRSRSLSKGR